MQLSGRPPNPDEEHILQKMVEYWEQVRNEAPVRAVERLEDAAKQLITITAGLQALYIAIFAFSNNVRPPGLMARVGGLDTFLLLLLFFAPLICWLISLYYAAQVFMPQMQSEGDLNEVSIAVWQEVKEAYGKASKEKLRRLHHAHIWLVFSFGTLLVAILLFVLLPV